MGKAGFAYLLGKGDQSANFLAILTKNDSGGLVEDGEIFDFFDSMSEMEGAEGYCASSEFQQAFKIAMARMKIEEEMEESGEDVMPVQVTPANSAQKTSMGEQPTQDKEARKEKPRRTSPRKKKQDVPVETMEFTGKEANASDNSSFGAFGAELARKTSPRKKKQDVPVETVEFTGKEANASDTSSFGAFGAEHLAGEQDDEDEEKDIPSTPVADGLTNWAGMWNSMQEQGWDWMPGDGLVDWYYVHPSFAHRSKSEVLKKGKVGEDYFVNEESMMRYAKQYLGFRGRVKTPESNNNDCQRRGRKRPAAVATTAEPIVETKKRNSKAGKMQADETKQAGKKHANETKGKKKTKILKSTCESESVDEGRKRPAAAVATAPIDHNQVLGHNENELAFRQMQLTIEQHSKEINLLKDKMKNSRANERAAAAEADAEAARREKNDVEASLRDVQEDLELQQETTEQVAVTLDIWQSRFDRVYKLAEAAGVDNALLRSIRDGHMI